MRITTLSIFLSGMLALPATAGMTPAAPAAPADPVRIGAGGAAMAPAAGALPDQLSFEQHLRTLDEHDRDALFAVPDGYREVR